ncbi:P-loop containing nucleoside triphosphate hydrolase protein, partial [Mycena epipterygia]
MPPQPSVTDIRLKNILACLNPTITLLNEVDGAFDIPFIKAISNTTLSLVTAVQNVRRNKDKCVQLMKNIHKILLAIINLHMKADITGSLSPTMLNHVGKFTETLHKIHTFVEAQQDGSKIKHFFRQNELNSLHKGCLEGLEEAVKFCMVEAGLLLAESIAEWQLMTQKMHQEVLNLVANLSDGSNSDTSSSIYQSTSGSQTSSTSFSLLPAQPKILHGRQSELEDIVASITQQPGRIAILGTGGIGKTALAKAALQHPDVSTRYKIRFFIAADSTTTSIELAALIGSHLGLKPEKDLTKLVVQYLSRGPSCLLVLDNLETPWEPVESRGGVEEFLSLLTDVPHLALIITMRGAERPAKVRWTRPFLEPLQPLSYDAAHQMFIEIADDCHDSKDIDKL